MNKKEKKI